jgi:hypothetical protein
MSGQCCQNCGHVIDARRSDGVVERLGLIVCIDPPVAFYRHRLMTKAPPTCVRFLFILARWGEAAYDTFYPAMRGEDFSIGSLHANVSKTRRWLEENEVDVAIEGIRDWGFRLTRGAPAKTVGDWSAIKQALAEAREAA